MRSRIFGALALIVLAAPGQAGESRAPDRPSLDVRALPRIAISPTDVNFTARLVGGAEMEDFHCPEVEWDWADGARSVRLSDCEPYQPGDDVVRVFSARHRFRDPGVYAVTVRMRRATRVVAAASVTIDVKEGIPGRY